MLNKKLTYVIISFNYVEGLINVINQILKVDSRPNIIVVDNYVGHGDSLQRTIELQFPFVKFIKSKINNRFHAYNLALGKSISEYVTFRTDDDEFYEYAYIKALENQSDYDIISGCHIYENNKKECIGTERPIESFIFKSSILDRYFPINTSNGSDWNLLRFLYSDKDVSIINMEKVFFRKRTHGRPS